MFLLNLLLPQMHLLIEAYLLIVDRNELQQPVQLSGKEWKVEEMHQNGDQIRFCGSQGWDRDLCDTELSFIWLHVTCYGTWRSVPSHGSTQTWTSIGSLTQSHPREDILNVIMSVKILLNVSSRTELLLLYMQLLKWVVIYADHSLLLPILPPPHPPCLLFI